MGGCYGVPAVRVFSLSFRIHLFVACIVSRVVDILNLSDLSGVGGNPLVLGLLVGLESVSFRVHGGLRVHVGLVDEDAQRPCLEGSCFPPEVAVVFTRSLTHATSPKQTILYVRWVYSCDGSRRCPE
jgi:hypothetical protein